jgi:L,D-transpeptidase ErfK/SrfK
VTAVVLASLAGPPGLAQDASQVRLVGEVKSHLVSRGDTLTALSARLGVERRTLAADNGLTLTDVVVAGSTLRIDNRHIVPEAMAGAPVVVNIPQRMVFHRNETVTGMPVAVGGPQWATPTGSVTIVTREENPTWDVPRSILDEARRRGRSQPARVPPGPANPLGAFWLGLSLGSIGLHGTNAPTSIYGFVSHGCIRLHPDDIAWLFSRVAIGDRVEVIYEPVLLAAVGSRVFLEVHSDPYRLVAPTLERVRDVAAALGLTKRVDWAAARRVTQLRHGVARDVTAPESAPREEGALP